ASSGPPAVRWARLHPRLAASVHRDVSACVEDTALRLDVEDTRGAQSVLGRKRAGQERDRAGEAGTQAAAVAEERRAFRQDDPIDPVLDVAHLLAHVDAAGAGGILAHAGRLKQHAVQRVVLTAGLALDVLRCDLISRRAATRLNLDALLFELLRDNTKRLEDD